jgi:hypothetical protein
MEDQVLPPSLSRQERFELAAKPLIEFLSTEYHPHVTAIVTSERAEILEGLIVYNKNNV